MAVGAHASMRHIRASLLTPHDISAHPVSGAAYETLAWRMTGRAGQRRLRVTKRTSPARWHIVSIALKADIPSIELEGRAVPGFRWVCTFSSTTDHSGHLLARSLSQGPSVARAHTFA